MGKLIVKLALWDRELDLTTGPEVLGMSPIRDQFDVVHGLTLDVWDQLTLFVDEVGA